MSDEKFKLAMVKHNLESALRDLDCCDCYGLLSEAHIATEMALEFVEDEIARRESS